VIFTIGEFIVYRASWFGVLKLGMMTIAIAAGGNKSFKITYLQALL